jgi:hypothetical protein
LFFHTCQRVTFGFGFDGANRLGVNEEKVVGLIAAFK